jgi:glutamate carboxypeptidase
MTLKGFPMPVTIDLPVPMRALLAGARRKQAALLDLTQRLVRAESPSDDKAAVNACVALAAAQAKALGGHVKLHRQKSFGDLLEARFGPKSKAGPCWDASCCSAIWTPFGRWGRSKTMPCRLAEGRLWGPGTLDMKAGAAMAFTAIEMLAESGLLNREIVLLLNTDEEVGSPASRPITERLAAECAAVFVVEPAQGLAYKTARKGVGDWRIDVTGVAAHAGLDFEKGANALRELARIVETVSGWTNLKRGVTVNLGVMGGGYKSNVIPAQAWAEIDVRVASNADGPRIERKFATLKPTDKRCTLTITGSISRPPMMRTRGTVRLYRQAQALAAELGFPLEEAHSGGASDGNFTSALGIPTLDGMGAVGEGAHAPHESILVEHLAPRTALLAGLLAGCSTATAPDTLS